MIVRQFKDQDISLYGMGCMRLPMLDESTIEEAPEKFGALFGGRF